MASLLHRLWPTCLRAIPDLWDDCINDASEVKLRVPFYCQSDCYSCGATAGWSVLKTFHPKARFAAFYRAVNPLPLEGASEARLVRALRRHGVGVSMRRHLTFSGLCAAIESGFPVIAGIGHECEDGDHWVVIYGIGRRPARVFLCNQVRPGCSREELSWAEFRSLWNPRGEGLVCWGKSRRR